MATILKCFLKVSEMKKENGKFPNFASIKVLLRKNTSSSIRFLCNANGVKICLEAHTSVSEGPRIPSFDRHWKIDKTANLIFECCNEKKYGLLTEVKMAGYCPSSFFLRVYGPRRINTQKRERDQCPVILTEQAWSIKDLLYGIKHQNKINFPCGTKPVSRAGKIAPTCTLG